LIPDLHPDLIPDLLPDLLIDLILHRQKVFIHEAHSGLAQRLAH
jgi:hypothetical protein